MTRRGKLLMIEGLLLYGLARGVSIDELYALAFASIVFPLLAMGFVRLRRHDVTVTRTVTPRRLFAGGTAHLTYSIRNAGRSNSPPLILEDAVEGSLGGRVRVALPALSPDRRGQVSIDRRMPTRGRYTVGPLHAHVEDPFGLASMPRQAEGVSSLTVYPAIEVLHEATPRDRRPGTGHSLAHRLAVAGDEFYAIRDWQHGDDLRRVHWRSTAKRGSLQIRQDEIFLMNTATTKGPPMRSNGCCRREPRSSGSWRGWGSGCASPRPTWHRRYLDGGARPLIRC